MSEVERRRTILDCAARLLAQYGHTKTTMADIAREANIGVGSLYLEFASKDEIVAELSSSIHERVIEAMRRAAEVRSGGLSERLHGVLEVRTMTFLALAQEGAHACELVHCSAGAVKTAQAKFKEDESKLLAALFDRAHERGELARDLDPKHTAALVQRVLLSLSPPFLYQQPHDTLRKATRETCTLLLSGLLARSTRARVR